MLIARLPQTAFLVLFALAMGSAASFGQTSYILGADDQITIQALHVPDISDKPVRIDAAGFITLPLAGRIQAAGLSVEELQRTIAAKLDEFIQKPEVVVSVAEFRSQPISVAGSVNNPGVYQLAGHKTLTEMLSLAGGPKPDAADIVRITRGNSQCGTLPNARQEGQFTVGELSLHHLFEAKNPADNFAICAGDVITLPRAQLVYVLGEVKKPGGFALRDQNTASVLQALSMSEGLLRTAASTHARILRIQADGRQRSEIPVDLKAVLDGKAPDVALQQDDILLVPNSTGKTAVLRATEAAIQMATGVMVWRTF